MLTSNTVLQLDIINTYCAGCSIKLGRDVVVWINLYSSNVYCICDKLVEFLVRILSHHNKTEYKPNVSPSVTSSLHTVGPSPASCQSFSVVAHGINIRLTKSTTPQVPVTLSYVTVTEF